MIWDLFGFKKKSDFLLALDIGTEAIKVLIFSSESFGPVVFGAGLAYFDRYDIQGRGDFDSEIVKKAISQAFETAKKDISLSSADKKTKTAVLKKKKWKIILTVSPDILRAEVSSLSHFRKNPKTKISRKEESGIYQNIICEAKRTISERFFKKTGILARDMEWILSSITSRKIDGYEVSCLSGYEGKKLDFDIFSVFSTKDQINRIKKIVSHFGFNIIEIIHLADSLTEWIAKEKAKSGVFIDIGGSVSQIIAIKNNRVKDVKDFSSGARAFTETVSLNLGLDEFSSRLMLERYFKKELSVQAESRIKEFSSFEKNNWYSQFMSKMKEIKANDIFPANLFITGGGAAFQEFRGVLEEKLGGDINSFSFNSLKIGDIKIKDFPKIIVKTKNMEEFQFIPCLLMCYYVNNKHNSAYV